MISICEGVEKLEHSRAAGRNVKRCSHFGKNSCRYSVKQFTIWPSNFTSTIHSKDIKVYIHTTPYTRMFTVIFLIIAEKWKQHKSLSAEV